MRVACMRASRSITRIDGGTNRISRTILVADKRHRQIDGLEIEAGGKRLLALGVLVRVDRGARGHEGDQVADVHHADRIVERVVIDHQARMAGALEHAQQFAERDVLLHVDDVRARDHDVADAALAQAQDILEHAAFVRREAEFAGRHQVEHVLEVGADRALLPAEQRTQRAHEPVVAAFARAARTGTGRLRGSNGIDGLSSGMVTNARDRAREGSGMFMERIDAGLSSPSISSACESVW